jgi:hypothetical protein
LVSKQCPEVGICLLSELIWVTVDIVQDVPAYKRPWNRTILSLEGYRLDMSVGFWLKTRVFVAGIL